MRRNPLRRVVSQIATVTSLSFDIKSGWSGSGVDDAMAQLKVLKDQIDELSSKRLQITADATETQATIADVKKQIDDLNRDVKLGVEDEDAKTKLLELKAELDALNNRALAIKVDKSQADAEMAALKLELDRLTADRKVKVDVDGGSLRSSLDSAKADMDQATTDMSNDWNGVGKAGRAASLNLVSALVLLLPAIIPLSEAVLGLGGAMVSAFGGAGIAAAVFGASVKSAITSAQTYNTTLKTQNATLLGAQQTLANTAQTNTSYTSALLRVHQAQTAVNTAMANGGKATAAQNTALTNAQQTLATTTQTSSAYSSALLNVNQAQAAVNQTMSQASAPQKQIASGLSSLTASWKQFQQAAAISEAPLIESVMKSLAKDMSALLPIIPAVSAALRPFIAEFAAWSTPTGFTGVREFVAWIVNQGVPNLSRLITFVLDIGRAIGQVALAFTGQGAGLTQWLDKVGSSLDKWGSNGGFTRFAATVSQMMPEINKALGSLGLAIGHVIEALHDFSGTALGQLTVISGIIASLPVGVVEALFMAFEAYKVIAVATAVFKTMAVVVDALKVAYAATEGVVIGFALGVEGATAAEGENIALTAAMAAGRLVMAAATGIATVATIAWTDAAMVASMAMDVLLGPIGLIIVAVAAVGFGIYELVTHWSTAWRDIKGAFDVTWAALKTGFDDVVGFLRGEWGLFVLAIPVIGWMIYVAANWKSIWGDIQAVFSTTINGLKSAWDSVSSAISGAWNTFWSALKSAALAVWDFLVSDWMTQLNAIKSAWDTVSSAISGAWDTFWNGLKSTAKSVWDDITSGIGGFASGVESAFTKLVSDVSGIWTGIENVFSTPVNFIIRIWNDVAGAIGLPKINTTTGSQGASTAEAGTAASNNAGVHGLAGGGRVVGPGGPREDRVPIMASNGEYMMNADAVQHYGTGVMDSINTKKFAGGGLIGDITGFVGGLASGAAHVFGDVTSGAIDALKSVAQTAVYDTAKPVINGIVSAVPNPVPGVGTPGGSVPHAGIQTMGDFILDHLKASQSTAQASAKSVGGTIPTGQHLTLINEALQKAGIAQSQWSIWEAGLNTLITRESGWNPTAINLTDSNAAAGHPSQGLMQTIPSTFAEYSLGGSITDPLSNIVAGIRYIVAQYGSISNVQQANANLPPKGYDNGGPLLPGMTLANNTTGTVEGVLNPTGLAAVGGLGALSSLNSGGGFKSTGGTGGGTNSGGTTVYITAPITIQAGDGATAAEIAALVEAEFEKLATMIESEVGTK